MLSIVRLFVDHPRYAREEERQVKVIGRKDAFFRKEEKYQFPPDITPLILAAHHNDHEIIQLFLSRGYTIDKSVTKHVCNVWARKGRAREACHIIFHHMNDDLFITIDLKFYL